VVEDIVARPSEVRLIGEYLIDHVKSGGGASADEPPSVMLGFCAPTCGSGLVGMRRRPSRGSGACDRNDYFVDLHLFPRLLFLVLFRSGAKFRLK
jgi:hypothetical protein